LSGVAGPPGTTYRPAKQFEQRVSLAVEHLRGGIQPVIG
jgi:hypothetical protein